MTPFSPFLSPHRTVVSPVFDSETDVHSGTGIIMYTIKPTRFVFLTPITSIIHTTLNDNKWNRIITCDLYTALLLSYRNYFNVQTVRLLYEISALKRHILSTLYKGS